MTTNKKQANEKVGDLQPVRDPKGGTLPRHTGGQQVPPAKRGPSRVSGVPSHLT